MQCDAWILFAVHSSTSIVIHRDVPRTLKPVSDVLEPCYCFCSSVILFISFYIIKWRYSTRTRNKVMSLQPSIRSLRTPSKWTEVFYDNERQIKRIGVVRNASERIILRELELSPMRSWSRLRIQCRHRLAPVRRNEEWYNTKYRSSRMCVRRENVARRRGESNNERLKFWSRTIDTVIMATTNYWRNRDIVTVAKKETPPTVPRSGILY